MINNEDIKMSYIENKEIQEVEKPITIQEKIDNHIIEMETLIRDAYNKDPKFCELYLNFIKKFRPKQWGVITNSEIYRDFCEIGLVGFEQVIYHSEKEENE